MFSGNTRSLVRLEDQEEKRKFAWWKYTEKIAGINVDIRIDGVQSMDNAWQLLLEEGQGYDNICSNMCPDTQLKDIVFDDWNWEPFESWKAKVIPTLSENAIPSRKRLETSGTAHNASRLLWAILPKVDFDLYQTKVLLERSTGVLSALTKYYCTLGIKKVIFEIHKLPEKPERLEIILASLLQIMREWNNAVLIIKFDLKDDGDSETFFSWFGRLRNSCYERKRLLPGIKLQKNLPNNKFINEWVQANIRFIFLDTDIFTLDDNTVKLQPLAAKLLVKLMTIRAHLVVEPNDPAINVTKYQHSLRRVWQDLCAQIGK